MRYICLCTTEEPGDYVTYEGSNIYDFKDGFWIDSEGRLSNQTSGKYWIPPARIYYIEKVEKIEGD